MKYLSRFFDVVMFMGFVVVMAVSAYGNSAIVADYGPWVRWGAFLIECIFGIELIYDILDAKTKNRYYFYGIGFVGFVGYGIFKTGQIMVDKFQLATLENPQAQSYPLIIAVLISSALLLIGYFAYDDIAEVRKEFENNE